MRLNASWNRRRVIALATLPLVLTGLVACGSSEDGNSGSAGKSVKSASECPKPSASDSTKVTLAYNPGLLSSLPISIAIEKGYFKDQGIGLTTKAIPGSANELFPQLARGSIDLLAGGPGAPLFNARGEGFDVKVTSAYGANHEGYLSTINVVATPEAAAKLKADPTALKSMRVEGLAPGSPVGVVVHDLIEQAGLSDGDVKVKSTVVTPPDLVTLFKNHGVDVAGETEPLATLMREQGIAVPLKTGQEVSPELQTGLMMASDKFLSDRVCAAVAVTRAIDEAGDDLRSADGKWNDELSQIAVKYWNVPKELLGQLGAVPYMPEGGAVDVAGLKRQQDIFVKQGLVKKPADMADLVDASIVKAAGGNG